MKPGACSILHKTMHDRFEQSPWRKRRGQWKSKKCAGYIMDFPCKKLKLFCNVSQKCEKLRAPCTVRSHDTKSHMLGRKLNSGTSKTKRGQGGLVRVALFWKSQCTTCSQRFCRTFPVNHKHFFLGALSC